MSFSQIRPGGWANASTLLASEMASLDARYTAIDGGAGGTYAPSAPIIIGGLGLDLMGAVTLESAMTVTAPGGEIHVTDGALRLDATGTFDVHASSTWYTGSAADFQSGSSVTFASGSTLALNGAVSIGATGVVTDNAASLWHINGEIDINSAGLLLVKPGGALTVDGTAHWETGSHLTVDAGCTEAHANSPTFSGGASFTGGGVSFSTPLSLSSAATVSLGSILAPSGTGRVRKRVIDGVNADMTYSVSDADIIVTGGNTAISAPHTYTLLDGSATGDMIEFIAYNATNAVTLNIATTPASDSNTYSLKAAAGNVSRVKFVWLAGQGWILRDLHTV